jgi:hypothetical protein
MKNDDFLDGHVQYPQLTSIPTIMAHIRRMGHTFLEGAPDPGIGDSGTRAVCERCGGRLAVDVSRQPTDIPLLTKGRLEVDVDERLLAACVHHLWFSSCSRV